MATMLRRTLLFVLLSSGLAHAAPTTVTVKSGDTLFKIASRQGLSVAQLKALNGLGSDVIRAGQVLRVSAAGAVPAAPSSGSSVQGANTTQGTYTVKSGDFLSRIGAQYGVSVAALQAANGLRGTVITPGQRLVIPARGAPVAQLPRNTEVRVVYTYVRVAAGQTANSVAEKYRLKVDDLRRLNGFGSARQIAPGTKVLVPARIPVPIPPAPQRQAVSFKRLAPLNIPMQVVSVDLRHRDVLVAPVLPTTGLNFGVGARVSQLARRSGARALINGSYFHPNTYAPAGDIVMQGRMLTWGRIPMALAITPDNRATIRASTTPLLRRPLDTTWAGMETVIATGPRILAGGHLVTAHNAVFRDPALFGRAARSAVGLTSNRDLILVSTHAKLTTTEMGKALARLGIKDALLLDGGSSAGIAWNGVPVLDSVRKVSYGIGVFTDYAGRRYAR